MDFIDMGLKFFRESLKYVLVSIGVFQLHIKSNHKKWLSFLLFFVAFFFLWLCQNHFLVFRTIWYLLFLMLLFEEEPGLKIRIFILEYFLINFVDIFLHSFLINIVFIDKEPIFQDDLTVAMEWFGVFIWLVAGIIFRKRNKESNTLFIYVKNLSHKEFFSLVGIFLSMAVVVACIQAFLYKTINPSMRKLMFLACMAAFAYILAGCYFLVRLKYEKIELKRKEDLEEQIIQFQKKYYEKLLEQDESVRKFRHDFKNHVLVMNDLVQNKKIEELEEYLKELKKVSENFSKTIRTGNYMTDFFVNKTLSSLNEKCHVEYSQNGRFPENITKDTKMDTMDFCALISNIFDNVKETLEELPCGEIWVEIMRYKEYIYIVVANTCSARSNLSLVTTKKDEGHGYGTKIMKSIVAKYDGEIHWNWENNMMSVAIELPVYK